MASAAVSLSVLVALFVVYATYIKLPNRIKSSICLFFMLPFTLVVYRLLFMDSRSAPQALARWLDPTLGVPIENKIYADDCNSWSSFVGAIDLFVVAHTAGWVVSTTTVRCWRMAFLMGVVDELVEIGFACQHSNFAECWWDHSMDLACNLVGVLLGSKLCDLFSLRPYKWFSNVRSDTVQQWALVHILLARIAVFLCIFGTKYVLWIPDEHYLNILQPFIHIVLVERVTHEHHTVPPRLDVNNKWSFLARVRWWLIAAWIMWGGNLAMIAKHGYFGPCLFEGPLRVTAVALWVILLAVSSILLVLLRAFHDTPRWLLAERSTALAAGRGGKAAMAIALADAAVANGTNGTTEPVNRTNGAHIRDDDDEDAADSVRQRR